MTFERKIRINNRNFYLGIELKYGKDNLLTKINGVYFDMGDLSIMIDDFETNYNKESKKFIYVKSEPLMNDVIYLYDRFPFISYIKASLYDNDGNITINKDEITNYIKTNKIKINRWDKSSCRCPLLYE